MKKYLAPAFLFVFLFSFFAIASMSSAQEINCLNLEKNLKRGSLDKGSVRDVANLQAFLKAEKHLNTNITGFFGSATQKAVRDFQKKNKISTTGTVGPLTRAFIKKLTCIEKTTSQVVDTPVITTPVEITQTPVSPTNIAESSTPAPDEVLTVINSPSLKVKAEGTLNITSNSVTLRGSITDGGRSGTERWFELTTNKEQFKASETIVSPKVAQRSAKQFDFVVSTLKPATTYYFRVCAQNIAFNQKSCSSVLSFTTSKAL